MKERDLCFNVSNSKSSYEPNPPPRPDLIPMSLEYACLQWAHHIAASGDAPRYAKDVESIFWPKFLFWLEVLSAIHRLGDARGLLLAAKDCAVSGRLWWRTVTDLIGVSQLVRAWGNVSRMQRHF
jgi:hypothetical protein